MYFFDQKLVVVGRCRIGDVHMFGTLGAMEEASHAAAHRSSLILNAQSGAGGASREHTLSHLLNSSFSTAPLIRPSSGAGGGDPTLS